MGRLGSGWHFPPVTKNATIEEQIDKVLEEAGEVAAALECESPARVIEEYWDLVCAVETLGRALIKRASVGLFAWGRGYVLAKNKERGYFS